MPWPGLFGLIRRNVCVDDSLPVSQLAYARDGSRGWNSGGGFGVEDWTVCLKSIETITTVGDLVSFARITERPPWVSARAGYRVPFPYLRVNWASPLMRVTDANCLEP